MENLQENLKAKLEPYLDGRVVLLVGFSGGRDSLALLHLLHELNCGDLAGRYHLVAAHMNHNLRGAAAAADELFCREFCAARGIEYIAAEADLSADMSNLEDRARRARYGWFAKLRQSWEQAGYRVYLLTAHHMEDQAETVLLHMLRGSGGGGLAAMREQAGWHLRPFLATPRELLERELVEAGLNWREDESNADVAFSRNFIRLEILPQLKRINPRAAEAIAQAARIAAAEEDYFDGVVGGKLTAARQSEGEVAYVWDRLGAEPLAIRRRLVRGLWCMATGQQVCGLNLQQVEAVLSLAAGGAVTLSGAVQAMRRREWLILRRPSEEELFRRREKSRKGQKC